MDSKLHKFIHNLDQPATGTFKFQFKNSQYAKSKNDTSVNVTSMPRRKWSVKITYVNIQLFCDTVAKWRTMSLSD